MRILMVNDDGINARGIRALARALSREHEVLIAAPDRERSAAGHSTTVREAVTVKREDFDGIEAYAVSGTPADCARLGVLGLSEKPIDLVVSGPNHGLNLSLDVLYSGTVSAALEAAMHGCKGIAVSAPSDADFEQVAEIFVGLLKKLDIARDVNPVLSVNMPAPIKGKKMTAKWAAIDPVPDWGNSGVIQETSPMGDEIFWLSSISDVPPATPGCDRAVVKEGNIALTPLTYLLTDREKLTGSDIEL